MRGMILALPLSLFTLWAACDSSSSGGVDGTAVVDTTIEDDAGGLDGGGDYGGRDDSAIPAPDADDGAVDVSTQSDQVVPPDVIDAGASDVLPPDVSAAVGWHKGFGAFGVDDGDSLGIDTAGNVVLVGELSGSASVGGPVLGGDGDLLLAKYDSAGTHVWSKRYGGDCNVKPFAAAVDSADDVVVAGRYGCSPLSAGADFGGNLLPDAGAGSGWSDVFVAKYDQAGNHEWSKGFGDELADEATAIAVDVNRNIFVAGGFVGTIDLGGGVLSSSGAGDLFLAKFDRAGKHLWSKRFGGAEDEGVGGMTTVDSSGAVLLAGVFRSATLDFGGGALTSPGSHPDLFVAKLDGDGNHIWSKSFGGSDTEHVGGLALDHSGNIVVTGNYSGTTDLGGSSLGSAGASDVFVAKYDQAGQHLWSKGFGSSGWDKGKDLAIDSGDNIVVVGEFGYTMSIGGASLPCGGTTDAFVVGFSASGTYLFSDRFGGPSGDSALAVAVDAADSIYLTGHFADQADGMAVLQSVGMTPDIFLFKLVP